MTQLPSNVILIGLHGPMGAGKDTLANMLISRHRTRYIEKFKFATHLYAMAAAFDEVFDPAMSQEDKKGFVLNNKELGTRRQFLEYLGTEFGRKCINPQVWLMRLHFDLELLAETSKTEPVIAIVTDVRFDNEADYIRKHGTMVHLIPHWDTGSTSNHASAQPLLIQEADWAINLAYGAQEDGLDALTGITEHLVARAGRFVE